MRDRRLLLLAIGAMLLSALVLSLVTISPTAFAKGGPPAKIQWSQNPLTGTVTAGGALTSTVVFTSTADLTNATVRLTPSLKGTTVVSPTTFASIVAGQPYSLEVVVTLPADAKRQTWNGTLTLRSGHKAFARPLGLRFKLAPPAPTPPTP